MNRTVTRPSTETFRDPAARRSAGVRPVPPSDRARHRTAWPHPVTAARRRAARVVARLAHRGAATTWPHDPSPLAMAARHSPGFDVRVDVAARVLVLSGEMDAAAVHPFMVASATLTVGRRGGVTLDLYGLRFIDAAGLGAIVALNNILERSGQSLTLCHVGPRIRRMFALGGLAGITGITATAG